MYPWIWRHLPGPLPVRLGVAMCAVCVLVALLFFVVFPVVGALLPPTF